jgi:hypothetical protein
VIDTLDQNPDLPAADRVFGPFRLAVPLPSSVGQDIQTAANLMDTDNPNPISFPTGAMPRHVANAVCQFNLPPGETLAAPIQWFVERHGPDGITSTGFSLIAQADPLRIGISYGFWEYGDIVVYGTALTASGRFIIGRPLVIESYEPEPEFWELTQVDIEPAAGTWAVGTRIRPFHRPSCRNPSPSTSATCASLCPVWPPARPRP